MTCGWIGSRHLEVLRLGGHGVGTAFARPTEDIAVSGRTLVRPRRPRRRRHAGPLPPRPSEAVGFQEHLARRASVGELGAIPDAGCERGRRLGWCYLGTGSDRERIRWPIQAQTVDVVWLDLRPRRVPLDSWNPCPGDAVQPSCTVTSARSLSLLVDVARVCESLEVHRAEGSVVGRTGR